MPKNDPDFVTQTQRAGDHRMFLNLSASVKDFLKGEDGPTAVEYAVMLALIVVVCITAITALGSNAKGTYTTVGTKLSTTSS
jgi:pilus assembly protein Flp/PilA